MQFTYTADWVGDYVAPTSTVLTQPVVAEGGEIFWAIVSHLRRLYPEVYGPAVSLGRVPERREFLLREGGIFSIGNSSVTKFSKLGAYTGIFNNLSPSIARMRNTSPSLTNFYLDTPLVGPTMERLEYAPSPGRLGQPHSYPLTRTGGVPHTGASKSPPPPPTSILYNQPMDASPHWSGATAQGDTFDTSGK